MPENEVEEESESRSDLDKRLLFNQTMTALLIGISTQAFSKWGVVPYVKRGREALYYWPDVLAERDRRYLPDPDEIEGPLSLDAERARLAAEQADKIAMENAIKRGEVAYLPDVAEQQARVFEAIRAKALNMPTKCAPLANPENPNLARDAIEREVIELLAEISAAELDAEQDERAADVPLAADDLAAAAEAHGDGVG